VDVGGGGLAADGGAEGEEGNAFLFEVAHEPAAFDAVGGDGDVDAVAVVEAHGAVEGGGAAGGDGEFAVELAFEVEDDGFEVVGGEFGIALEAGDAGDGAVGEGGDVDGFDDFLFGADHGGDFGEGAGAVLDGFEEAAGAVDVLFEGGEGGAGGDAEGDEVGLGGEALFLAFEAAGGGFDGGVGLFLGEVLDGDAGFEVFGDDGVVLGLAEGGLGLFDLAAGDGAGVEEALHLLEFFAGLAHGGGIGRGQKPGGENGDTRPLADPHYTFKCSTTKHQEFYLPVRTPRKQPKKAAPAPTVETVEAVLETTNEDLSPTWMTAYRAADEKQAVDIHVLDLRGITSMTDVFFICHGRNTRQNQAICDEIEKQIKEEYGQRPLAVEGLTNAEWILMDYGDLVIHIFSEAAREYYDLERLYREAKRLELPPAA